MSVSLDTPDAEELADFLWFLSEWLTNDPRQLGDSLARFMGSHPYGIDMLRHDISRFRALLSAKKRQWSVLNARNRQLPQ